MKLPVTHETSPKYEIAINPIWCDIGFHKVSKTQILRITDVAVCEECFDHCAESWK